MDNDIDSKQSLQQAKRSSTIAGASWLFHRAAREGDVGALEHLLAQVNDCNEPDWEHGGRLALHEAVRGGHVVAVKTLLAKPGIDASVRNCQGQNALHVALRKWPFDNTLVVMLLEAGCDANAHELSSGLTPLHFLLRHSSRARTEAEESLVMDALKAFVGRCDLNCQDSRGWMAVHFATSVAEEFPQPLKMLASNSADLNVRDHCGETALMMAVDRKWTKAVETLITCGANVDTTNRYRQTALHYAANRDAEQSAFILVSANCDTNSTDLNGDTALHLAAGKGNTNTMARILQSPNIRLDITNVVGKRPLEVAKDGSFITVVQMLESHMQKAGVLLEVKQEVEDVTLRYPQKPDGNPERNKIAIQHRTVVLNGALAHLPDKDDSRETAVSVSRLI